MRNYIVKKSYDEKGKEESFENWKISKLKSNGSALPRGGYIFVSGVDSDYPALFQNENGSLTVVENSIAKAAAENKANFEVKINEKLKRQDFGRRLIAIISDRNESKDLTSGQTVALMGTYSDIMNSCLTGSIDTAKDLITAATPDGIIVTENDKTALLDEITEKWSGLGYE